MADGLLGCSICLARGIGRLFQRGWSRAEFRRGRWRRGDRRRLLWGLRWWVGGLGVEGRHGVRGRIAELGGAESTVRVAFSNRKADFRGVIGVGECLGDFASSQSTSAFPRTYGLLTRARTFDRKRRVPALPCQVRSAHIQTPTKAAPKLRPNSVSLYSTFGGTTGCTVRAIRPSRSIKRRVCVSIL